MFAKFKPVVLLLFLISLAACGRHDFTDARGNDFQWEDFQDRWLVVNYWAEWCKPCLEEIPELNELYHARAGADTNVLGIHFDQLELAELQRQIQALNVEFPVLHSDPEQKLAYLQPEVLPTTYIFDKQGQLMHKLVGPQTRTGIESLLSLENASGSEKN